METHSPREGERLSGNDLDVQTRRPNRHPIYSFSVCSTCLDSSDRRVGHGDAGVYGQWEGEMRRCENEYCSLRSGPAMFREHTAMNEQNHDFRRRPIFVRSPAIVEWRNSTDRPARVSLLFPLNCLSFSKLPQRFFRFLRSRETFKRLRLRIR